MMRLTQRVGLLGRSLFMVCALGLAACSQVSPAALTTAAPTPNATASDFTIPSTVALAASTYSVPQQAGSVTVTVVRTGTTSNAISVAYATADGNAVAGLNYVSTSGSLQWGENDATPRTISVPINNTTPFSGTMSFTVVLSGPSSGATIGNPGIATVTITGDAAPPSAGGLEFADATYTVAQNAGSLTVVVNRSGGASGAVSVGYATSGGTAVAGTDYSATNGTLQWADGDTTAKTFSVPISNATPFTGGETFTVALSSVGGGASLGTPDIATVTITGDASPPVGSLQLSASSYPVAQAAGTLTVTVNRTGGSYGAVSVGYATSDGTAVAGADYSATNGTLQWADGDTTAKTFSVPIGNATPFSGNKTFTVALSGPSAGATIASPGSATVTITGDAVPPIGNVALSASSYGVAQNAGSVIVTVNRAGGSNGAISVAYGTSDGTAVAGTDYTATSGTLQWADGDTTAKTFSVAISNATPFFGNKSFTTSLSNPGGGTTLSSPSSALVTIAGDAVAAPGSLQLSSAAYTVAQAAGSVIVTVNRTGGSSGAISVGYATSDGTAAAGTDYTATSGTLQWADGDVVSKTFSVPISNATPFTGTKSFTTTLANPSGGTTLSSPSSATATIIGDAVPPVGNVALSASSYAVAQNAGSMTVTVNRTGGSSGAISIAYATSDGTAIAGTDYTATGGTLQWADGNSTPQTFSVPISNATPFIGSRTFTVALSSVGGGASLGTPGIATVTITGDASPPVGSLQLSASSYPVAQAAGTLTVTVNRTGGSYGAVSVRYATSDGTAVAGTDYSATNGTLQWADGDTTAKAFSVPISNATPFSGNKTFTVALSGPTGGATIASPGSATVTITGDAVPPVGNVALSASSYGVAQNAGSIIVTVNRTGGSSGAISVAYATSDGTAVAGTDYTATGGTLQWADGNSAPQSFAVPISNATPFSGTRSFSVTLSGPTGGATLGSPTSATATISGSAATGTSTWAYYEGVLYWPGNDSVNATINYTDTAGVPMSGPYDVAVQMQAYGEWQPALDPLGTCITYVCLNTTPYNYFNFSFEPTTANEDLLVGWMSALDTPDGGTVADAALNAYCTNCTGGVPAVGQWNTYKIPLSAFGLTDVTILKFWIQEHDGINTTMYFDNVGLSSN